MKSTMRQFLINMPVVDDDSWTNNSKNTIHTYTSNNQGVNKTKILKSTNELDKDRLPMEN